MTDTSAIHIIGGGMAGSEAAWQAAEAGARVVLHEMRGVRGTEAHQTDGLAELVCSNSFRSDDHETNAVGLLHEEMRRARSIVMDKAALAQVPAGGALAVDRHVFSGAVTAALEAHPNIEIVREEIAGLPAGRLGQRDHRHRPADLSGAGRGGPWPDRRRRTGLSSTPSRRSFTPDSVDMSVAWKQSRYDKGETEDDKAAYINCPMDRDQYQAFIDALMAAETTAFKDWEKDTPYFDGCLPIEVMAERGRETLRHGPMKPRGLTNAHKRDEKPYAVVQLRQDNALGTLFNMVGFQTKMKYGAQADVFKMIPGLENARFARLGGIHRNTFLNSPRLLDPVMRLKARPALRFAGQITGVEGYVESAAMGLLAGRFAAAEKRGQPIAPPPPTTALGALLTHITTGHVPGRKGAFQPMNVNFGLFPETWRRRRRDADGKRLRGQGQVSGQEEGHDGPRPGRLRRLADGRGRRGGRVSVVIALLHGVNVGGHNRVAMAELRAALADGGLPGAQTYVQSGNIVVHTALEPPAAGARIEAILTDRFSVTTTALCYTAAQWSALVDANPFPDAAADPARLVVLLSSIAPDAGQRSALEAARRGAEAFTVTGEATYLKLPDGQARSKLAATASSLLGAHGTLPNWRTVLALNAMAGNGR